MKNPYRLRIVIDGNEANVPNRVGSNVYAFELLCAIEKELRGQKDVSVVVLLAGDKASDLPKERIRWRYQVVTPTTFWTQLAAPLYIWMHRSEFDVYFTPGHYAPRWCALPYVSSVMDLAYEKYPQQFRKKDLFQLQRWTRSSVAGASEVVAISNSTAKDIVSLYKKPISKVNIVYPALPKQPAQATQRQQIMLRTKLGIRHPYFLYLGTLQPRKNVENSISAFEKLCERGKKKGSSWSIGPELQLVLAGKVGWLAQPILDRVAASPVRDQILLPGYVTDKQKQALYTGALATLNVGLYEGFGIPSLESLFYGAIPIVSNTSSLPEVVGPAGILVSPTASKEISLAMEQVLLLSAKDRAIFRQRMSKQLQKFSWAESAQKVLAVLRKVATA